MSLFQNISATIFGFSPERENELKNIIVQQGGQVTSDLTEHTTHLVTNHSSLEADPDLVNKAESAESFIVTEEFFFHSLEQAKRLDERNFLIFDVEVPRAVDLSQDQQDFDAPNQRSFLPNFVQDLRDEDEEEEDENELGERSPYDDHDDEEIDFDEDGMGQNFSIHSQLAGQNLSNYNVNLPELSVFFIENDTPFTDDETRTILGQISHLDTNPNEHYDEEGVPLPPLLQKFISTESQILPLLREALLFNAENPEDRLGITRVKVIEIVVLMIGLNYHRVDLALIEQGLIAPCIALFFQYTSSNVLHCLIQRLMELILLNTECVELKHHLLLECNFAEQLSKKFLEAEEIVSQRNGSSTNDVNIDDENRDIYTLTAFTNNTQYLYLEHMKNIANLIVVCSENNENLANLLSQNVHWTSFVDNKLRQYNQRELDLKQAFPEVPPIEHPPVFNFFF